MYLPRIHTVAQLSTSQALDCLTSVTTWELVMGSNLLYGRIMDWLKASSRMTLAVQRM